MEGLLSGAVLLDNQLPLRSALYRALIETWRAPGSGRDGTEVELAADHHLQLLSPDGRAALRFARRMTI